MDHYIQSFTMFLAALGAVITALNKIDLTKLRLAPRSDGAIKHITEALTAISADLARIHIRIDTIEDLIHKDRNIPSSQPPHPSDPHT